MKPLAVKKLYETLSEAGHNINRIHGATNFQEHRAGWSGFVSAFRRFYKTLEAGCLGDSFDQEWLDRKVRQRDEDSLLNYLRHARNAAEYGLEDIVATEPGLAMMVGNFEIDGQKCTSRIVEIGGPNTPCIRLGPHEVAQMHLIRPNIARLTTIVSSGKRYLPPTSHKGEPIAMPTAMQAAMLGLKYLEDLFREAQGRVL